MDPRSGKVWARKFAVAHDCGLIINPDGLPRCIKGNLVQDTSRALAVEVALDRPQVSSVDWLSSQILARSGRHRADQPLPAAAGRRCQVLTMWAPRRVASWPEIVGVSNVNPDQISRYGCLT
jgi:hypothetical protein